MKTAGAAGASLALPGGLRAATDARAQDRPNIIVILADDMGFSDLRCFGSEIDTPNLDRLSQNGLRFTQFYNAARCCPTRASLLTGLYPHQAGVGHMTSDHGSPAYQGYLNRQCVTIAEALKPAGYHTIMSGKWHVGHGEGRWPVDRGFDECFGILRGSSNYFNPGKNSMLAHNRELVEAGQGFYTTDAFTDHAIESINNLPGRRGNPYFLYLAFNAPHWPLHAWPEDIAKYEGRYLDGWDALRRERYQRQIEMGIVDPKWKLTPRDRGTLPWKILDPYRRKRMARKMAVYAAMVDRMDQNVGRLVRAVEQTGQLDNTLVVFLSDNGACHESGPFGWSYNPAYAKPWDTIGSKLGTEKSFASYGRSWSNAGNTPFRLHKHWTHEGGISAPLIAHWPSVIRRGGEMTDQTGHVIDIMATCLDVAGVDYPEVSGGESITPLEGKSLVPVFNSGKREGHENIFWEHEGNRGVRAGKWKIVSDYPGDWELYDLEEDRTELSDLAGRMPEKALELAARYQEWADRCGVKPWSPLKTFKY